MNISTTVSPGAPLSVVFVAFNSASVLPAALASVRGRLATAEIIVVDNASTDDTIALVKARGDLRLISNLTNLGFGRAVNLAARAASGKLLLVLNPDVILEIADVERIEALATAASAGTPTGLLGCSVQEGRVTRPLVIPYWPWRFELAWWMWRWFLQPRELLLSRPRLLARKAPVWVSGAAFVVSRRETLDIGGFNSRIFLYDEDRDLSRAYNKLRFPVKAFDGVMVTHAGGKSSPQRLEMGLCRQLLGLVEHVARWEGATEARHAARAITLWLRALEFLAAAGSLIRWFAVALCVNAGLPDMFEERSVRRADSANAP